MIGRTNLLEICPLLSLSLSPPSLPLLSPSPSLSPSLSLSPSSLPFSLSPLLSPPSPFLSLSLSFSLSLHISVFPIPPSLPQIPSREVDRAEEKFWMEWNPDTKQFFLQFHFRQDEKLGPSGPMTKNLPPKQQQNFPPPPPPPPPR